MQRIVNPTNDSHWLDLKACQAPAAVNQVNVNSSNVLQAERAVQSSFQCLVLLLKHPAALPVRVS